VDLDDPSTFDAHAGDRRLEADLPAQRADVVGHRLPHLAGPVAGVVELADEARVLVVLVAEEGRLGRGEEVEVLDALRRPLGTDLRGRHPPHLLGVGLEEELEQPLAEAVRDPLLQGLLLALALQRRPQVGEHGPSELDRAELLDDVSAAQGVVKELAVPVDARHARTAQELLAHDLVPEGVDLLGLGEEAVAAEVEPVAVALDGLGDAAELILGLENDDRAPLLGQQVAGSEPGGPAAEDDGRPLRGAVRAGGVGAHWLLWCLDHRGGGL
jgi:hypothetical protein